MDGQSLGLLSLRWDAVYCATSALVVLALASVLGPKVGVPVIGVASAGAVVGAWAAFLWCAGRWVDLRTLLWLVLGVNVVAAAAAGAAATLLSSVVLSVVLAAVALEVATFAASQAVALRRLG